MCGADDCRSCFPSNFRQVGRLSVYVGDMDEDEEREALETAGEAEAERQADAEAEQAEMFAGMEP
jgi:hypothetical protein